MSLPMFFFSKIVLAIWGSLKFHMNLRMNFSISAKNPVDVLIEIMLTLQITLGNMDILTISVLPINQHGIHSHFFLSFSGSFINILQLSVYRPSTSWIVLFSLYDFLLIYRNSAFLLISFKMLFARSTSLQLSFKLFIV